MCPVFAPLFLAFKLIFIVKFQRKCTQRYIYTQESKNSNMETRCIHCNNWTVENPEFSIGWF